MRCATLPIVVPLDARDLEITGPDVYCTGTPPITLEVSGGSGYEWTTLTDPSTVIGTGSRFEVAPSVPTSYIARCTLCSNTLTDTFFVDVQTLELPPDDLLPPDSVLCPGETISLGNIYPNTLSYTWSNGSTDPFISVTQPGVYSLTLTTACSTTPTDTIRILDGSAAAIAPLLPPDTLICDDDVLQLGESQADPRILSYDWSVGANTPALIVTAAGTYRLSVETVCGETLTEEIEISPLRFASSDALLGPDRLLCPDDPETIEIVATQQGLTSYTWSGDVSATTTRITVPKQTGRYILSAETLCDSVVRDTLDLQVFTPPSNWPPQRIFTQCGNVPQRIGAEIEGALSYRWNTGDTTAQIVVTASGDYQFEVLLQCDEVLETTIRVQQADSFALNVSNAFTPNGDGLNDRFPGETPLPEAAQLYIWSRWGRLVYLDTVQNGGWDGTLNGKTLPEGVYTYVLEVPVCDGNLRQLSGTVTLLR